MPTLLHFVSDTDGNREFVALLEDEDRDEFVADYESDGWHLANEAPILGDITPMPTARELTAE